jgi:hypothetical protein
MNLLSIYSMMLPLYHYYYLSYYCYLYDLCCYYYFGYDDYSNDYKYFFNFKVDIDIMVRSISDVFI